MPIDLKGYKVVYKDRVYNALEGDVRLIMEGEKDIKLSERMLVMVINEDNIIQLLNDFTTEFRFIKC